MKLDSKTKTSMIEHIKNHSEYPATKADIVKACSGMSDFTKEQKTWFERTLPSRHYENANEVIRALGW